MGRRYGETDDDYEAREAAEEREFQRRYRHVKTGYVVSALLLVLALVCFIGAIATSSGPLGGIGGVLLFPALVTFLATVAYHNLSGVLREQEQRNR